MTIFIIIGIVVFILYTIGRNQSNTQSINSYSIQRKSQKTIENDVIKSVLNNIEVKVISSDSKSNYKTDSSIIDVTNQGHSISYNDLKKYSQSIPHWSHRYVYSASELDYANAEQTNFYKYFKQNFLNGVYYDLEGNLNYAFILLFDLLDDYETHRNILTLEGQIKQLGKLYPKTKSYGISFLSERMEARGDNDGVLRLVSEGGYSHNNYNDDYWKLGGRYKSKLNLNDEQVKWLNRIWQSTTTFCNIEFCMIETIRLYLAIMSQLKTKYSSEGSTLEKQFLYIADIVARKHFRYRTGSDNYKYSIDSITSEIYLNVFKHAENTVRDQYWHKRKVSTDTNYTATDAKLEFDKLSQEVNAIIPKLLATIKQPDEQTEIALYGQNTTRWKLKFEQLKPNFNNDVGSFVENIISLGKLNKKNPSVENIFYEASKFIAKHDKQASLVLYIHYLYHDLKSAKFDNRQLTKTLQKNLFKSEEQLKRFEEIVNALIKDRDLDKALGAVQEIYAVKRKRIALDRSSIQDVQKKHSGTVDLLNEYLKDEDISQEDTVIDDKLYHGSIQFQMTDTETIATSVFNDDLRLSAAQIEILEVFAKNNFTMPQNEVEVIARSKGMFKNQLIDSINDKCYELLDDVLIEEDDDLYTINENYYSKILFK